MAFTFRSRFVLGRRVRIQSDEPEVQLVASDKETVVLRAYNMALPLKESAEVVLRGWGYPTEEAATVVGQRWVSAVKTAFARNNVGADFGDRAPKSFIGERVVDGAAGLGQRIMNDEHGLMVFATEPVPGFMQARAGDYWVGKGDERVVAAIHAAWGTGVSMTRVEALAYDLYSASFNMDSADGRFMMLMMALETLIEQAPRSQESRAHIDHLIELTRGASLPDEEKVALANALGTLKSESINRAGQRLAATLSGRTYVHGAPEDPVTFFKGCWSMRNDLVHGAPNRPPRDEVDYRAAALELFVGHLLSRSILNTFDY